MLLAAILCIVVALLVMWGMMPSAVTASPLQWKAASLALGVLLGCALAFTWNASIRTPPAAKSVQQTKVPPSKLLPFVTLRKRKGFDT